MGSFWYVVKVDVQRSGRGVFSITSHTPYDGWRHFLRVVLRRENTSRMKLRAKENTGIQKSGKTRTGCVVYSSSYTTIPQVSSDVLWTMTARESGKLHGVSIAAAAAAGSRNTFKRMEGDGGQKAGKYC